jgi:NodT family efflux transporter outer membrane factor (OMF) lipoprotein
VPDRALRNEPLEGDEMKIRRRTLIVPTLIPALLTACAVGPDYHQPAVQLADKYVSSSLLAEGSDAPAGDLKEWWRTFNDPLLVELVEKALSQSLDIEQVRARLTLSHAQVRTAEAALLPNANLTAQAAQSHLSVETPEGRLLNATPHFDRNASYVEAHANVSWELDFFGGNQRGKEAANAAYQSTLASVEAVRLAVAAQTADTFITIRGLQERLKITNAQIATRKELLRLVLLQNSKGVAADLQVDQARASLSQAQAAIPVLTSGLNTALNALDVVLGAPPGTHRQQLLVESSIPATPPLPSLGTPSDLLRRRPDLIVAERNLAAAHARIGVATSDYYPKVSFGALLGTATTAPAHAFEGASDQASGFLGLRWRLFDFGRVDAEVLAAQGQTAQALAAYRLAALHASEDVENALSEQYHRSEQARILGEGEASLTKARTSSEAAYKSGLVSLIEVLDSDDKLLATRDAKAQAQTYASRAAVSSFKALGGGWQSGQSNSQHTAQIE